MMKLILLIQLFIPAITFSQKCIIDTTDKNTLWLYTANERIAYVKHDVQNNLTFADIYIKNIDLDCYSSLQKFLASYNSPVQLQLTAIDSNIDSSITYTISTILKAVKLYRGDILLKLGSYEGSGIVIKSLDRQDVNNLTIIISSVNNNMQQLLFNSIYSLTNLKKLDIYSPDLIKLPDGLEKLKYLTSLNLYCSSLQHIPIFISKLDSLETLTVSKYAGDIFPEQIIKIPNLETLKIQLSFIEKPVEFPCVGSPSIKDLSFNISDDGYSVFQNCSFGGIETLTIQVDTLKIFPDFIFAQLGLKHLIILYNYIKMNEFPVALHKNALLETVFIYPLYSNNAINVEKSELLKRTGEKILPNCYFDIRIY